MYIFILFDLIASQNVTMYDFMKENQIDRTRLLNCVLEVESQRDNTWY